MDTTLLTSIGGTGAAPWLKITSPAPVSGSCPAPGFPTATPIVIPRILHTGSIATFLAPGAAAVKALLEQSHPECMVTYDPNIRPDLLGTQAEARSVFEELVPFTNVVKLSDEDALWLYPRHSVEDAASRILKLGAELVAMTLGPGGRESADGRGTGSCAQGTRRDPGRAGPALAWPGKEPAP
ncbi:hypothetical protein [Arthrobacter sp. SPG23]|uniref:hypothetical protein n=1 Tax=Arthrobacter sp. SPG23 TaxID=1610703 RepID=UPI000AEE1997